MGCRRNSTGPQHAKRKLLTSRRPVGQPKLPSGCTKVDDLILAGSQGPNSDRFWASAVHPGNGCPSWRTRFRFHPLAFAGHSHISCWPSKSDFLPNPCVGRPGQVIPNTRFPVLVADAVGGNPHLWSRTHSCIDFTRSATHPSASTTQHFDCFARFRDQRLLQPLSNELVDLVGRCHSFFRPPLSPRPKPPPGQPAERRDLPRPSRPPTICCNRPAIEPSRITDSAVEFHDRPSKMLA